MSAQIIEALDHSIFNDLKRGTFCFLVDLCSSVPLANSRHPYPAFWQSQESWITLQNQN
jgi:hypothetical protein